MAGVAADILTGFLGAGKTTLLKHVLEHGLANRRVAVVMNEFGDLDLDGKVIGGLQAVEQMVELNSGCICCSVGTQFTLAIREILRVARPHLVVIEATGVAEPGALARQVKEAGLALDAVVTVVDAANVRRQLAETEVALAQIRAADFLVLNKTDLVDARTLRRVEGDLRVLNPRALLHTTHHGQVDTDLLFGTSVGRLREELRAGGGEGDGAAGAGGDHLHADAIEAFSWRADPGPVFLRPRFEGLLRRLPRDLYRAKGLVHFHGEGSPCLFNFTCGRWEIDWFRPPGGLEVANQAVFIGRGVGRHEARIRAALDRCRPGQGRLDRLRMLLGRPPQP